MGKGRGASLQGAQCDRLIDRLSSWRTPEEGAWHNYGRHWHCTSLAQRQAACNVRAAQGQRRKVNERGKKGERGRGDWVECQTRIWILKLVWPTDNNRWRWQWWRWVQGRHLLVVLRPPPPPLTSPLPRLSLPFAWPHSMPGAEHRWGNVKINKARCKLWTIRGIFTVLLLLVVVVNCVTHLQPYFVVVFPLYPCFHYSLLLHNLLQILRSSN